MTYTAYLRIYVRRADGITYVRLWQTRLRCLPAGSDDAALEPARAARHLVSDDALCGDQSVADIRAAIDGAVRGECQLAAAMYARARSRWRPFAEFEMAN